MTRINTNVSSLTAQKTLNRSNSQLQEALTRLSTGLRINVGKDDPAGLIASEVLRSDIISVQKAISNSQRANQLIATADSALGQVSSLLNDIRGLVSESANTGALSAEQLAANQLQVDSSLEAIDRIAQTTQFQGARLLDGSLKFINTADNAAATARGTFGVAVDSVASGQLGSSTDISSTGTIGAVAVDARASGSIGMVTTDALARGSFGTTVDQKAAIAIASSAGGGSVQFTAQEAGYAGNDFAINFTAGGAAGVVGVAFDGTAKTLQFSVTSTTTAADIVSALQATPSAYLALSASVLSAGTVTAAATASTANGASNNNILLSANVFGAQFNNASVTIVTSAATGAETASYNTGANTLTITLNSASTTAQVVSAINSSTIFTASTTGSGLGRYTAGTTANATTGGSANNTIVLSATSIGSQFNNATVTLATGAATGSETAAYNTGSNTLTVTINDQSTTGQIIQAINTNGTFTASTTGAGLGRNTATSSASVTTGGSANNQIRLDSGSFGSQFNNAAVVISLGAALGAETASYNTGSNILSLSINAASTTASVISAINTNGTFRASTTGAGLGNYTSGALTNVTSGGSADNRITLAATSTGAQYNNTSVTFSTGAVLGGESATYNTATNSLTVSINSASSAAQVANAINATGVFSASLAQGASGLGRFTAATLTDVTSGGSNDNRIVLSATTGGAQFNNTSVVVAHGASLGSESASYNADSNTLTLNINASSTAAQVVAAINQTGVFGASLASGSSGLGIFGAGTISGVTSGAGASNINDLKIDQANFGTANSINVNVQVDRQATKATLNYAGGTLATATTLEIGGSKGFETISLGVGATLAQIADAVNLSSDATGVSAQISGGSLNFVANEFGSNHFVSVKALNGSFATTAGGAASQRTNGQDVDLRINGIKAAAQGLRVSLNTSALDLSFSLNDDLGDGASFDFAITGGGAVFQLGPDVVSNQQARVSIDGINTATLGGTSGRLFELRSGGAKALTTDVKGAAAVVEEVISSVTSIRGRLGAFQRTTLETNIATLSDTLENLTDAESSIRDADFAAESARLTRAQILVQSGTQVLAIANQSPQNILALLR